MRFAIAAFLFLSLFTEASASMIASERLLTPKSPTGGDERDEALFREVTSNIFCPCGCDRMLVWDCNCKTANEIKEFVKGRIDGGAGKEEIIEELKARYGERIIPISPEKGFGLMARIASVLAFLAGASAVVLILRTWVIGRKEKGKEIEVLPSEDVERYKARIERELEKYK